MAQFTIVQLTGTDVQRLRALSNLFANAFEDTSYTSTPAGAPYLSRLLECDEFVVLVAMATDRGVPGNAATELLGGLVAYELPKFEQERSEFYLYDLAVHESVRRQGIATALINQLNAIAVERGVPVVYVQADVEDTEAVALYQQFGKAAPVVHFDLGPASSDKTFPTLGDST